MATAPPVSRGLSLAAAAAAIAALVALTAHGRWPYPTYEIFRWIIAAASLVAGYQLRTKPLALATCVGAAVLFNPIAPFRMRAYEWQRYDILVALAMGAVAGYAWKLRNASTAGAA